MSGRFRTCRGKKIELRLVARRFVCSPPLCRRRIFAERFDDGVVAERSRRTSCLECVVHHLGWRSAAGRPRALPNGWWCRSTMIPCCDLDRVRQRLRRRFAITAAAVTCDCSDLLMISEPWMIPVIGGFTTSCAVDRRRLTAYTAFSRRSPISVCDLNQAYVSSRPARSVYFGRHPVANSFLTSISLQGVPSGFAESVWISPVKPMTSAISIARSRMETSWH